APGVRAARLRRDLRPPLAPARRRTSPHPSPLRREHAMSPTARVVRAKKPCAQRGAVLSTVEGWNGGQVRVDDRAHDRDQPPGLLLQWMKSSYTGSPTTPALSFAMYSSDDLMDGR